MNNELKQEILQEFDEKFHFEDWLPPLAEHTVVTVSLGKEDFKYFLSSALDRYARALLEDVLPEE
jgi:hypothetical protein